MITPLPIDYPASLPVDGLRRCMAARIEAAIDMHQLSCGIDRMIEILDAIDGDADIEIDDFGEAMGDEADAAWLESGLPLMTSLISPALFHVLAVEDAEQTKVEFEDCYRIGKGH